MALRKRGLILYLLGLSEPHIKKVEMTGLRLKVELSHTRGRGFHSKRWQTPWKRLPQPFFEASDIQFEVVFEIS
jgi:hypothetical protein